MHALSKIAFHFTIGSAAAVAAQQPVAFEAELQASNAGLWDGLGSAVAVDGDTLVASAPREDGSAVGVNGLDDDGAQFAGAAYVYVRSGSSWAEQAYLKASNTDPGDEFGSGVAIDGDTIVIGAPEEDSAAIGIGGDESDDTASRAGAVYVFVRVGGPWQQQAYVKASNTDSSDSFGVSVSISGDTLVVGALAEASSATGVDGDPSDNSAPDAGAVYVFVRDGSTWSQQAYLKASNADAGDAFGGAVAIDGDTLVVGAIGEDSPARLVNGVQGANGTPQSGAAYVFVRNGTTWTQEAYLKPFNTQKNDYFGAAVAVAGDTVVVGAPGEDSGTNSINGDPDNDAQGNAGAAYVFVRNGTSWTQQAYLKAFNSGSFDEFGAAVGISGDRAVVGAASEDSSPFDPNDNAEPNSGAAYVFERFGSAWIQLAHLKDSPVQGHQDFGWGVSISGDTVAIGEVRGGLGKGAAHAFGIDVLPVSYCTAKASSNGCLAVIGTSSALQPTSGAGGYFVTANEVHAQKAGLVIAGNSGAAAIPFSGGTLCVAPPLKRGPIMSSAGTTGCDGSFVTQVNVQSFPTGLDAGPGQSAWYQYWYRDPQGGAGTLGTALSGGVRLDFQ